MSEPEFAINVQREIGSDFVIKIELTEGTDFVTARWQRLRS
jgi:hypothetical protein